MSPNPKVRLTCLVLSALQCQFRVAPASSRTLLQVVALSITLLDSVAKNGGPDVWTTIARQEIAVPLREVAEGRTGPETQVRAAVRALSMPYPRVLSRTLPRCMRRSARAACSRTSRRACLRRRPICPSGRSATHCGRAGPPFPRRRPMLLCCSRRRLPRPRLHWRTHSRAVAGQAALPGTR